MRELRKADNALTEKVNKIEVVVAGVYVFVFDVRCTEEERMAAA